MNQKVTSKCDTKPLILIFHMRPLLVNSSVACRVSFVSSTGPTSWKYHGRTDVLPTKLSKIINVFCSVKQY